MVHLWLGWKARGRLVLIEFFSLALMAAALLSEICGNRRFSAGVGHFQRKF